MKKRENHRVQNQTIEEQALVFLRYRYSTSDIDIGVQTLYDELRKRNPSLTDAAMTDLVWRLVEQGRAEVEDLPPATDSLRKYLGFWERNLWFYASLATSLITVLVIYVVPPEFPVVVLRWILGVVFVLFIPGYVTVEALFPKGRDLDGFEHFALSVGLSLALVMLIGLLLNFSSWGIGLNPIVISLTILSVGLAVIGLERQFRICAARCTERLAQHE